jgi:tetratricopeptide (TPR) repeat protein
METVDTAHLTEEGHDELAEAKHEKAMDFLGQPRDWIERFGRNFYPSTHEHLDKPGEAGEILPWLRLSADMDPQRIETYTVGAFWLRLKMGKVDEAEQFLREGLRANPDSYAILLDLGRLYDENRHDAAHARNLWELGLRRWHEQEQAHKKPDETVLLGLLIHLADLEERQGNLEQALQYREKELSLTPQPDYVKKEIENLRAKLEAKTAGATNQKGGKPSEK